MQHPSWLDRSEYPFTGEFFPTQAGNMHYIDVGQGGVLLFVHGNPDWSFSFRNVIKILQQRYRCIAIDHIGFGLSDKPKHWSYLPQAHSDNLSAFIQQKALKNITLIVNDWGGPIALNYAVNNPDNIKAVILLNSWAWPLQGDLRFELFSKLMSGALGQLLINYFNLFVRLLMKQAMGNKKLLTRKLKQQYLCATKQASERKGMWVFPQALISETDWLATLEKNIKAKLSDKPVICLWGMKDPAFRNKELAHWQRLFKHCQVHRYKTVGHFPQEEIPDGIADNIKKLLSR